MAFYAVTGGAGFIGSHLADQLLADGHSVRILDDFSTGKPENVPPGATLIRGDVSDPATTNAALAGTDGCFHLAAIASVARGNEEWLATHRVNQSGSVAVFEAARRAGNIPVVYASSAAVYGTVEAIAHEALTPAPQTAYGVDKYGTELHARIGHTVHGLPTTGLRFFNVYGPRQDPLSPYSGVISIFARRIANGDPITIHGDGQQTRDFIYVADVVAHLIAAMQTTTGARVLNVCTGHETSLLDLVATLARLSNHPPSITHTPPRPGDIRRSVGAPTTALGIRARVTLEAGLRALLEAS